MTDKRTTIEQLTWVIAWELDAQRGVNRPMDEIPRLVADSVLDFFDLTLKEGAQLPG